MRTLWKAQTMLLLAFGAVAGFGAQTDIPDSPSNPTTFTLSGKILEKGTKTPVLGGSLYLEAVTNTETAEATLVNASPQTRPLSFSADADTKGHYEVSVPEGVYSLSVAGEGYKKKTLSFFAVHGNLKEDFYLEKEGFTLPEVVVTTDKIPPTQVSHETLSKEELTEVPGTQEDVLKAIQTLPGVVTSGSLNGKLLVRGSGPDDNQYYVDSVPIGFPYHFGITSTLDSNLVKDIDFYAGGFGPQFPNSIGGLVDLTQRDPRADRWGFREDVNLFLSEFELEGPIISNSSLAIAGRRSYFDLFVKNFTDPESNGIVVPVFGDYQIKYDYKPSPKVQWDFVAFGSDDNFGETISASTAVSINDPELAGSFNFTEGYNNQGVDYRDTSDDKNTFANTAYHTNSYFNYIFGSGLFEDMGIEDFGDKVSISHYFDQDTTLEGGVQYDHFINSLNAYFIAQPFTHSLGPGEQGDNFNLSTSMKVTSNSATDSNDFSVFADQKFKAFDKKMDFSIGARMDYINSDFMVFLTPRASAAYHLTDDTTLKASYGYYNEAPDRIIEIPYLDANLGNPRLAPEQSINAVLGFEQKLNESGLLFRVEGYEKDLSDLIVANPNFTPGTGYLNTGTGYARGLEFFLRQPPTERFFGWIAYSLSDSERRDVPGASLYPYTYDEPNVLTAVGTYKLNPGWDVGIKILYSTGQPFTPVESAGTTVVTSNGQPTTIYVPQYAPTDSGRLPDYMRVDFSTSFKTVYDTWEWKVYLDIVNLFQNQNVLGYGYNTNYTQKTAQYDLPLLPYLGIEVKY